jgi:TetR/AcrR family transcriptional repressor of nem operon
MGHSQADKALTRERILAEASTQIRKEGLESLSVGRLMQAVGLTHGGFYGHFASREDLVEKALDQALGDGAANARATAQAGGERARGFAGFVRSYLSRAHRDAPERGCAIGALVSDVGRADAAARALMAPRVERYIETARQGLGDETAAIVAVSAMVGALALSRVMTDPKRSDAILRAVRDYVIAMAAEAEAANG